MLCTRSKVFEVSCCRTQGDGLGVGLYVWTQPSCRTMSLYLRMEFIFVLFLFIRTCPIYCIDTLCLPALLFVWSMGVKGPVPSECFYLAGELGCVC